MHKYFTLYSSGKIQTNGFFCSIKSFNPSDAANLKSTLHADFEPDSVTKAVSTR